jgi:hypothetical protein
LKLKSLELYEVLFFKGVGVAGEELKLLDEWREMTLGEFNKIVAAIEELIKRLKSSQKSFEAIRDCARSLRDGVNSVSTLKLYSHR